MYILAICESKQSEARIKRRL